MTMTCVYCGERVGEKLSCCGENHFEERDDCPSCDSQDWEERHVTTNTAVGETFYRHCNDCGHSWGMK